MNLFHAIREAFALLDAPLRVKALLSLAASLLMVALETCSIFLVYPLILALVGGQTAIQIPLLANIIALLPDENRVAKVSLLIVVLMVVKSVTSVGLMWWQQGFINRGAAITAGRLLDQYMAAPLLWHYSKNSAELQRNVNTSVRVVFSNIILAALAIASEVIVLVMMCAVLMLVDPGAVLIAGGAFAASMVVYQLAFDRLPTDAGRRLEVESMHVFKELNQALGATRELRLSGRERHVSAIFLRRKMAQGEAFRMIGTLNVVPRYYLELIVTIILVAAVLWIARMSDGSVAVATIGLFGAATLRMLPSIYRILNQIQMIRIGTAALINVGHDLRRLAVTPRADFGSARAKAPQTAIALRGVTFTYPAKDDPAIRGIDVTISRGECVGIVGSSGAGKSTLVDVILGFLTPQEGSVLIDGEDITGRTECWRGVAGYVPQAVFLLDDTLRRNIALGLPNAEIDDAELRRAVDKAQLAPFVASLPDGLDTVVGERGIRLSGGQRQRIGIARALYGDPPVLIMDEGTSALDNETEERLTKAIELLRGDKTIVLVAHRLSTVQHSDRVLFMQDGRIVDHGTFDELTARHPDFARLVEIADLGASRRAAVAAGMG